MSEVRLHVALARAGLASRRHAEEMIRAGRVRVNGKKIAELGSRVDPEKDRIELDGQTIGGAEPPVTLMLNKPDAVLTTLDDPRDRETVADLIKDEPYRLRPVGRLDYHTEGLLLLSTDGELANRLLNPKNHVAKTYRVKLGGHPTPKTLDRLRHGVNLEDGRTRAAVVELLEAEGKYSWIEMIVTEGRNRLVRRMCEAVDHRPMRVVRVEFATLDLGDLRPGQYRYLTRSELDALYTAASLPTPPQRQDQRPAERGRTKLGVARRRKGALPGEVRKAPPPEPRKRPKKRRR